MFPLLILVKHIIYEGGIHIIFYSRRSWKNNLRLWEVTVPLIILIKLTLAGESLGIDSPAYYLSQYDGWFLDNDFDVSDL